VHSLRDGTETLLTTHGPCVHALALDATGAIAVTGGFDGVVRVGPTSGAEPHLLVGHAGSVVTVAVSPDGRRIASGSSDGTIRLWPMPDLQSRPMHTLPLLELLADLEAHTNLRALFDDDHPEGYVTAVEQFPSWSVE
jgi:WD40 repeat protein